MICILLIFSVYQSFSFFNSVPFYFWASNFFPVLFSLRLGSLCKFFHLLKQLGLGLGCCCFWSSALYGFVVLLFIIPSFTSFFVFFLFFLSFIPSSPCRPDLLFWSPFIVFVSSTSFFVFRFGRFWSSCRPGFLVVLILIGFFALLLLLFQHFPLPKLNYNGFSSIRWVISQGLFIGNLPLFGILCFFIKKLPILW